MHEMRESFIQGALEAGHTVEKQSRSLMLWRSLLVMVLQVTRLCLLSLGLPVGLFQNALSSYLYQIMLNSANSDYLTDALEAGFEVAPLSINTIPYHDKIANKAIYLGLKSIKGVSKDLALWILENRPYSNIEDFIAKLPENYLKLPLLEPLVKSWSFRFI